MNFAHNLFLLMFNLSQLHSRPKIIELFVDGLNDAFSSLKFNYLPEKKSENDMEIKTRNSLFGFLKIESKDELSDESRSLIQNAVQMLAVILERLVLEEKLQEEIKSIENIAEERNKELQQTVAELEQARKASLNLIEDLTEEIEKRRKSEKELKESEERFRLVMENSLDAILITNPDGSILNANKSACEMFQMTEEEISKAGRSGIVNVNDPNLPIMLEERKKKGFAAGELTFFRKDGTLFPADITTSVFTNSKGEPRTSMIIRDISVRKSAEEELRQLKDNLQEEVEEKTQELRQRIAELERFQNATIEREFRIKELREELKSMKETKS
jgi:PAS domain S-box-containing protein